MPRPPAYLSFRHNRGNQLAMFSRNDAPRGGHFGGRGGRGGRASSRSRKRHRDRMPAAETAANAPPPPANRGFPNEEEGEIPPPQHQSGPGQQLHSYAQAATQSVQTHHSQGRDPHNPRPFHQPSHLQGTRVYSQADTTPNELLFYGFFEKGVAATRELLQTLRKEVHKEVDDNFHIKIPPPTNDDDVITVVTRREQTPDQAHWTTTGDIRIRFASPDQARAVYHQQRGQRSGNNAGCLYTTTYHRCPVKIPDGTSRIPPDDKIKLNSLKLPSFDSPSGD